MVKGIQMKSAGWGYDGGMMVNPLSNDFLLLLSNLILDLASIEFGFGTSV